MKKIVVILLAVILCLSVSLCGCTEDHPTTQAPGTTAVPTDSAPPTSSTCLVVGGLLHMVQINGKLYVPDESFVVDIPITQDQIIGYTTRYAPGEIPDQDGESNCMEVGTPYAYLDTEEYPNTYVFLYEELWIPLIPLDEL